ncbi:MAG: urease accessory protein UreD [Rhodospirillaceae bacterium]|jgi:urease accessory protein|nr:urease accessory protein UreD [Rhodospirillaceae bacterium]MBT7649132.1 urease accessory protein UreD [Rhodospirillaceae bacterium]
MAAVESIGDAARPQLALTFARAPSGETFLRRQYAAFPFHITQPFLDDGQAKLILQSLGAGLVQGDRFVLDIVVEEGARAHVVTQGSTVVHEMSDGDAWQVARLEIMPGAQLVYLPRPLILFPGSRVVTRLEIVLHEGGSVMWCDSYLAHDRKNVGRTFDLLDAETRLLDTAGKNLAVDRFLIGGDTVGEVGVMQGNTVHASLGWAGVGCDDAMAEQLRSALAEPDDISGGISSLPNESGLFGRIVARDGVALQRAFDALTSVR